MLGTTYELLLNLPDDIFGKVFAHLPVEDWKSIRLTCRRFYEVCHTADIEKNEQIAFYGNLNTKRAILSLCDHERKVWNIRLNGVKLRDSMLPFFINRGDRIHSLILDNCVLKNGLLRDIIENCPNLRSFAFINTVPKFPSYVLFGSSDQMYKFDIFFDLASLRNDGIVCSKVTSFTLILPKPPQGRLSYALSNKTFLHIFYVFPNIKELIVRVFIDRHFDESSSVVSDTLSDEVFSFSCVYYQMMKMCDQLEKLMLHFQYPSTQSYLSIETLNKICSIEMKNLKELSLNLIRPDLGNASIVNIFSFENLTSLDCTVKFLSADNILLILNNAWKLRYLVIRTDAAKHNSLPIHKKCFEALVKSKLVIFDLYHAISRDEFMIVFAGFEKASLEKCLLPNRSLKKSKMILANFHTLSVFLSYFTSLETRLIQEVDRRVLRTVSKNQTQLRSLILCHRDWSNFEGLFRIDDSMDSLTLSFDNLTHLCALDFDSLDSELFVNLLSRFRLPKLKSLYIQMNLGSKMNDLVKLLWKSLKKFTRLEYLTVILNNQITFDQWVPSIEALPKLRHFLIRDRRVNVDYDSDTEEIGNPEPHEKSKCRQLFDLHLSLRTVIIHHFKRKIAKSCRYFKDITKDKVYFDEVTDIDAELEGLPYSYYDFVSHSVPMYLYEDSE